MSALVEIMNNIQNGYVYVDKRGRGVLEKDWSGKYLLHRGHSSGAFGSVSLMSHLEIVIKTAFGMDAETFIKTYTPTNEESAYFSIAI
jgi:hypothetical protein